MIKELLRKKHTQTVFTFNDISIITKRKPDSNLISNINYYISNGELKRLAKGIYTLDENFSKFELANKLRRPSYISFYTILQKEGIVFQPYDTIYLASNRSEEIHISGFHFKYRKLKDDILYNLKGVEEKNNVVMATPERALLDKIYLDGEEHFDNLKNINWNLLKIMNNEIYMSKKIERYILKYV